MMAEMDAMNKSRISGSMQPYSMSLELAHQVRVHQEAEDAFHKERSLVTVDPKQMRLLRKMSAVGLTSEDVGAYHRREQMSPIPDLASARVGLLFLFAAMAPVIWIPKWGGGWFLYFLPAILVLISLLVSLHSERQVRAEERQAAREEEQRVAIAAVMAAKKDKHHHHTHNHSKVHSHEGSVASSQRKSQVGANTSSLGSNVSQPPGSRMNPVRFERIESERALPYEGIYVKGDEGPAADTFSEDWMKGEGLESKDAEAWLEVGQMGQEGGDEYRQ